MTVYTDGTITLEQGSADVVGAGTAWDTSAIIGGVIYVEAEGGNSLPIATVNSDTSITAAIKWMGESGEYSYSLVRDTVSGQQTARNAQLLSEVLQELRSPSLSAIAGVTAGSQKLVMFTGAASATTIDLAELIKGVEFDLTVADIDELEALTDVEIGKRVLVIDNGDSRSALYIRLDDQWTEPAFITGPQGRQGLTARGNYADEAEYLASDLVMYAGSSWAAKTATVGNAPPDLPSTENTHWLLVARSGTAGVVDRGVYSGSTAYEPNDIVLDNGSTWIALALTTGNAPPILPTVGNAYWRVFARKGIDGDGNGDVVGPSSASVGNIAAFGSNDGKSIADTGVAFANIVDLDSNQTLTEKTLSSPILMLKKSSGPVPTGDGEMEWDTEDDHIVVGDGASQKRFKADAFELIEFVNIQGSGLASIIRTNLSAFKTIRITGHVAPGGVSPLALRLSKDNGDTFLSGVSEYQRSVVASGPGPALTALYDVNPYRYLNAVENCAAFQDAQFDCLMTNFNAPGSQNISWRANHLGNTAGGRFNVSGGGGTATAGPFNALQIIMPGAIIVAGLVLIRGVRG
jgi:hypothetical protein